MPGHMQRQRSPATTRLDNSFAGLKLELLADIVHFRDLSLLQCFSRGRKIAASVDQARIEPELIEICSDVVMVMNILARTASRVRLLAPEPERSESSPSSHLTHLSDRSVNRFE